MNQRVTRRRVLQAVGTAAVVSGSAASLGVASSGAIQDDDSTATDGYTSVYRDTIDSVVLVSVSTGDGRGGLGSGFVVDDQHVVTNNHVVENAAEDGVELQFSTEEWRTASIVGTDPYSDLAVLGLEDLPDVATGLPLVESEPAIGQEVLVIGNPLGLDASVAQGIVSGVDRVLPSPAGFSIPATIQTDAPVNPGNSGGPMVNLEGDVLGVVFAGTGQTIGFAIPSRLANRVVPTLIEEGTYQHPYMGIAVQPVGPDIAAAVGLEEATGVLVVRVVSNSPAADVLQPARAGQPATGDVIVAIGDQTVSNQEQLLSYLALETSPGETVTLEIVRDGERQSVELTLEARPEAELPRDPIGGGSPDRPPGSGS